MVIDASFGELKVADVLDTLVKEPARLRRDASIRDAIDVIAGEGRYRKAYITDDAGKYIGTVTTETVLRLLGYRVGVREQGALSMGRFLRDALKEKSSDIMVKGTVVTPSTLLKSAVDVMVQEHLNDLPVVDENGLLIGELMGMELLLMGRNLFEA